MFLIIRNQDKAGHQPNNIFVTMMVCFVCVLALSGCMQTNTTKPAPVTIEHRAFDLESNMSSSGYSQTQYNRSTVGVVDVSGIMSSDKVQVFPLEGDTADPFAGSRKRRSVFENTTSGGYTVLNQDVMVFPLEDNNQRPSYLPQFEGPHSNIIQSAPANYNDPRSVPMVGAPINNLSAPGSALVEQRRMANNTSVFNNANDLPPIVTAPRLNMPAPSYLKAPQPSPFNEDGTIMQPPMDNLGAQLLPQNDLSMTPITGGPAAPQQAMPIGSSLTGYQEYNPATLAQQNQRNAKINEYQTLADRAGTSLQNVPLAHQEPVAMRQKWAGSNQQHYGTSVPAVTALPSPMSGGYIPLSATPVPMGTMGSAAPMQMTPVMSANQDLGIPAEQPRRSPRQGGMLTGY